MADKTLTLEDLVPGMKVRVRSGIRIWWHPSNRDFDGQVVTIRGREDDPSTVWSDGMAGGIFYAEESPYGFAVSAIEEIVQRPNQPRRRIHYLPDLPDKIHVMQGHEHEPDFEPRPGDRLRFPEAAYPQGVAAKLLREDPHKPLVVEDVRAISWIVKFEGHEGWWKTRGFIPDFEALESRSGVVEGARGQHDEPPRAEPEIDDAGSEQRSDEPAHDEAQGAGDTEHAQAPGGPTDDRSTREGQPERDEEREETPGVVVEES